MAIGSANPGYFCLKHICLFKGGNYEYCSLLALFPVCMGSWVPILYDTNRKISDILSKPTNFGENPEMHGMHKHASYLFAI